ncbi:hypothetical protein OHA61_30650 [Streptomyces sp. NBC_00885]|uniref:hypothetical protein n=1 Tax=Streptomyces sp. NBC_00885 TaxID=2975857 RepID=UPI00386E5A92|nr:hypothetical protein OHA61_30650 [Streptomyces sp. NBC_00885]
MTLLFTGVTTYYQARVSANQLGQAEENAARATREQASRVTFWTDESGDGSERLHLKNRSLEPVSDVFMAFYVESVLAVESLFFVDFSISLPALPPCTEVVISKEQLRSVGPNGRGPVPSDSSLIGLGVKFYDRDGKGWLRTSGKLEHAPADGSIDWADPPSYESNEYVLTKYASGQVKRPLTVKNASPCG